MLYDSVLVISGGSVGLSNSRVVDYGCSFSPASEVGLAVSFIGYLVWTKRVRAGLAFRGT